MLKKGLLFGTLLICSLLSNDILAKTGDKVVNPEVKNNVELANYFHELSINLDYSMNNWSLSPASKENTSLKQMSYSGFLSYGMLFTDHVEPFFEAEYKQKQQTVSSFLVKNNTLVGGAGFLFNLPIFLDLPEDMSDKIMGRATKFSAAKVIPYGGFMFSYQRITNIQGDKSAPSEGEDMDMITKLVFGIRFKIFDNLALNSSARVSYQKSDSTVPENKGGASSKLTVESKVLGLSLLF